MVVESRALFFAASRKRINAVIWIVLAKKH